MATQLKKEERIEFRVSPEEKKMFRRAQELSGDKTISSFVIRILRAKSAQIIEKNEKILASEKDREVFFQAVFADIEPNEALSEAAQKFKLTQE